MASAAVVETACDDRYEQSLSKRLCTALQATLTENHRLSLEIFYHWLDQLRHS